MKKILAAAYGAVVALLVSVAYEQLFTKVLGWPIPAALFGAVLLGIVLLVLYEMVGGSAAVARRLSPFRKVDGAWRINLTNENERPVSVCKIQFTHREYAYGGYGINDDGTIGSEWSSRDTHYDEQKDEMSFTSDATILRTGRRVRNYGYIKFYRNADGKMEYGNGYFVDMADVLTQSHMTLVRITDREFDEVVTSSFAKTRAVEQTIAAPLAPPHPPA